MFGFVFRYFGPFSLLLLIDSERRRKRIEGQTQTETNIKTVDLSGAAALANELRQLEKRRKKSEETQKTREGGRQTTLNLNL